MNLTFIDIETTGLEPGHHEIVQVAWQVRKSPDGILLSEHNYYAHPLYPERNSKEAIKINGYNEEDWKRRGAFSQSLLADTIFELLGPNTMFAGWGVNFDKAHLDALMKRYNLTPIWNYQMLDVRSLAVVEKWNGKINCPVNQTHVGKLLVGRGQKDIHDALDDVKLTFDLFQKLSRY